MKNIKSYKFLPFALLTGCLLLQPGCSSDYMDTVPTETVFTARWSLKIWVTRVWAVSLVS